MARAQYDWLGPYIVVVTGPMLAAYLAIQAATPTVAVGSLSVVYRGYPLPCSQWQYDSSRKYHAKEWTYEDCNGPLIFCLLMLAGVSPVVGWHAVSRWWPRPPAPPAAAWVVMARVYCWTAFGVAVGGIAAATVTAMALGWAADVWKLSPTDPLREVCDFLHRHAANVRREDGWPFGWLGYSQETLMGMACGLTPGVFLIHRAKKHLRLLAAGNAFGGKSGVIT